MIVAVSYRHALLSLLLVLATAVNLLARKQNRRLSELISPMVRIRINCSMCMYRRKAPDRSPWWCGSAACGSPARRPPFNDFFQPVARSWRWRRG